VTAGFILNGARRAIDSKARDPKRAPKVRRELDARGRIHTRYDRCAHTFLSAIAFAAVFIFWINESFSIRRVKVKYVRAFRYCRWKSLSRVSLLFGMGTLALP
jgi:hypothetical protein